ncbi:MAG TPA: DUF4956 domain-containing protein [Fibrobacteria bacterium]|jgi:hypothetical protein|nr:DUF4956 domain-containing protein [Fibrobacteria bacterium]
MLDLLTLQTTTANAGLISAVYAMTLAFLLGCAIAVTYEKTFNGLSYSRNFVQAMILGAIVAAMVMQAIGDNLARGLGILGALAIIRFRTPLRDPRDIIFIFAAMGIGLACGVYAYAIAAVGTGLFCLAAVFLHLTPFGQRRYFDGLLRFNMPTGATGRIALEGILREYCRNFALITLRETSQGGRLDLAYHVKLRNGRSKEEFVERVRGVEELRDVNLMLQETTVEV